MYRMIIIEDEESMRTGLQKMIPWGECGFTVEAAFEDGEQALAWLAENRCDVLMTDIVMPCMDGLELIGKARVMQPKLETVIISGHSDFTYAQEAVKLKASYYFLKPVDTDEMIAFFKQLYSDMNRKTEEKHFYGALLSKYCLEAKENNEAAQSHEAYEAGYINSRIETYLSRYKLFAFMLWFNNTELLDRAFGVLIDEISEFDEGHISSLLAGLFELINESINARLQNAPQSSECLLNPCGFELMQDKDSIINLAWEMLKEKARILRKREREAEEQAHMDRMSSKIIKYIACNIDKPFNNGELAHRLKKHPGYVSRIFKQSMGENLNEFIIRKRIEAAVTIIMQNKIQIQEICPKVGFTNHSYFTKQFKKITGYTPKDFYKDIVCRL